MRQRTLVTTVILLLAWVVAGVANYDQFWMGDTPSVFGTIATLVAIGAWPLAGWFSGRRFGSGFIPLASVFWIAVVIGAPALFWAWSTSLIGPPVGIVVPVLMVALLVPLYGFTGMLPAWEPVKTMLLSAGGFALTLAAYYAVRRLGRPPAQANAG